MTDEQPTESKVVDDLLRQGAEQTRQGVEQTRQGVDLTQQGVVQVEQAAQIAEQRAGQISQAHDVVKVREDLDEMLESPRLNEKYFGWLTRWRAMQIVALVFALVSAYGFYQARHERDARREEQCQLIDDGRAGIRELLDELIARENPSPEEAARIEAARLKALKVLPPVEIRDDQCQPVE
jgi:hypothetical protein